MHGRVEGSAEAEAEVLHTRKLRLTKREGMCVSALEPDLDRPSVQSVREKPLRLLPLADLNPHPGVNFGSRNCSDEPEVSVDGSISSRFESLAGHQPASSTSP